MPATGDDKRPRKSVAKKAAPKESAAKKAAPRKSAAKKAAAKRKVAKTARTARVERAAAVKGREAETPARSGEAKRATGRAKGRRAGTPKRPRSEQARRGTGGRREENKAATRERIVSAALELFERNGFQETTTKAIAKRAGIAEGTVFNYFPTKEDIALHFFELEVDHAIETVRTSRRLRKAPLEEKLFALVQSQIEYLAPYERFIGAAFVQALRPMNAFVISPRSWALRTRYLDFVQSLIDEEVPQRRSSALSWLAPQAFWVFYVGLLLYWLNDASPGKESTLAFLDRSLRVGVAVLKQELQ